MIKNIAALYENPMFKVVFPGEESEEFKQDSGIRQGCPLSPFLFILLMTVLFHDIHCQNSRKINGGRVPGISFTELLYADDTVLVAKDTQTVHTLLHAIEVESEYYNMRLNKDKCNYIARNKNNIIRFKDGSRLSAVEQVTYLGGNLNKRVSPKAEVDSRIAAATGQANKLKLFWKKSMSSLQWKVTVYNAIVCSKLLYGLETVQMTSALESKLDAFQQKGLRRILNIPPTFIDRSWTNVRVREKASDILQYESTNPKIDACIRPLSELLKDKRHRLLQ